MSTPNATLTGTYDDADIPPETPLSSLSEPDDSESDQEPDTDDYSYSAARSNGWVPECIARQVMQRDGYSCLVCSCAIRKQLTVVRLIAQDTMNDPVGQLDWLRDAGLSTKSTDEGRQSPGNMMTLCKPHARAYGYDVWRFVPSERWLALDDLSDSQSVQSTNDLFLLVIVRPQDMPFYDPGKSDWKFRSVDSKSTRVLQQLEDHVIGIDPGFAFIATMNVAGSWIMVSAPEPPFLKLQRDLDAFREAKDKFMNGDDDMVVRPT